MRTGDLRTLGRAAGLERRIMRNATLVIATLVAACAAACGTDREPTALGPTTPTAQPQAPPLTPPSGEAFDVSGIVTDDRDTPVAGVQVTMRYRLEGRDLHAVALTDASGRYEIRFTSTPWTWPQGRGAARAEIMADGYDWYWRTVWATGPQLVENFRLNRLKRIGAGESIVMSLTPDNGDCLGWLYGPCGRVRVTVPADGDLMLEAVPLQRTADLPVLEVCCVSGNEVYGNPLTIQVPAGMEVWVEVGQKGPGGLPSETVAVNTSFTPR
jgi:hypothetical protein